MAVRELLMVWITGAICVGSTFDVITSRQHTLSVWIGAIFLWPFMLFQMLSYDYTLDEDQD